MFVEVDFGQPQTIDQVTAESTPDQAETRIELEIESTPGQWHKFAGEPKLVTVAMPDRLRRAAIEELERNGVQWLVVHDMHPGARDFRLRQAQWGITPAGSADRFTLYHLD